jgi:hypothetical protein
VGKEYRLHRNVHSVKLLHKLASGFGIPFSLLPCLLNIQAEKCFCTNIRE